MKRLYDRLLAYLDQYNPTLRACYTDPPSRAAFDTMCSRWSKNLTLFDLPSHVVPSDLACWYLLTNVADACPAPLFGALRCYDFVLAAQPKQYNRISTDSKAMRRGSIVVNLPNMYMSLVDTADLPRGSLWVFTGRPEATFRIADSWANYLENFVLLLETGTLRSLPNGVISKWPEKGIPEAVTREMVVRAASVHHPETNDLYLFMYQISMSMPASASQNKSKLDTRHWRITDLAGKVQEVNGPGVIGEFPEIGPGDSFSYSSCCPLPTPGGTMEGHFVMVDLLTGERWNAIVPRMTFKVQQTITSATIAAGQLQTS